MSGNQVGVILGHWLLEHSQDEGAKRLVITTVVSSPLLREIAKNYGVAYNETLTGFKWIANRALAREASEGLRFVFGYEEALGYTVGSVVRDKDGISTAAVLATIAAELHQRGETLLDEFARITQQHGLYVSQQRSLTFPGAAGRRQMNDIMHALRENLPQHIGTHPITATVDCLSGLRQPADGSKAEPIELPKSNVLVFELDGGHRVIARPSGTEPKIKLYFDVREKLAPTEPLNIAQARGERTIKTLETELLALTGMPH